MYEEAEREAEGRLSIAGVCSACEERLPGSEQASVWGNLNTLCFPLCLLSASLVQSGVVTAILLSPELQVLCPARERTR